MKWIFAPCIALILVATLPLNSCVSNKKYKSAQSRISRLASDSARTHNSLTACNRDMAELNAQFTTLQTDYGAIQKEMQNLSTSSKMTIADQARRLKSLQDLIQSQRESLNRLRQTIADALVGFKADELSVFIKEGNVYVSLEEKLLFKSGSAVVDPKGKQALAALAKVLNNTPDIEVMIEGHTDTVPIKTSKFEDNWSLSVARATAIVRVLTKEYGVDPKRVIASGRSEFHPVRPNASNEGRASNRRTEIILSPNLTELYTLLEE